jgi:putative CocE/NonD family hydrolase
VLVASDGVEIVSEAVIDALNEKPSEAVSYYFDPKHPVESRGGEAFLGPLNLTIAPGALTQKGFCERDDVLTFSSPAFENDMTIAGTMLVKLKVSSDAEDTAFTAKLMDVDPSGVAVNIRDSISTLSYRNYSPEALQYIPNDIVDLTLDMWAIEWTLKQGHRLRLDISSSNFPAYNIHSNYAGNWAAQDRVKIAKQTIYSGSSVELPVVGVPNN